MLSSDFHCKENYGFRVVPVHPGLLTSDYGVQEAEVTVCGVQHVPHMRMKVQGRLMQAGFIEIHPVFAKINK